MNIDERRRALAIRDALAAEAARRNPETLSNFGSDTGGLLPGASSEITETAVFFVWDEYGRGQFSNIDKIFLRWVDSELVEYSPHPDTPFSFTDSSGTTVTPGRMLTDGGTIPPFATGISGIRRWSYGPAFIVHDWEYSLRHCDRLPAGRDREHVDRTMMEGVKTLMLDGAVPQSKRHFWQIQKALSVFAGDYWNSGAPCGL
ncbi:DUF1353 domain-containing protein [Acuticoccus sediminis]|uniref:DUF1353 domain-containing protein n=1 Tax=Acuticoccus sediminis TaxID=2184697 RepID=UPI001CFD8FC5|nr:DUF1353 domain-containing protein [Acuticoccus sediminis]